jgi:hypothetical protein
VLVAGPAERQPEQEPRLGGLVRRSDSLPLVASPAQQLHCRLRVAFGERHLASGQVHGRVERARPPAAHLVRVDDPLELGRRGARCAQVGRRDRDLHLGREDAEALQRLGPLLERARERGDRIADLPLGKAEERQARLRIAPEPVRQLERLLRPCEVAPAAADLADLVVAARRDRAVEVVELRTGRDRLLLGFGPVTAQPHDLGSMQPAGAGEAAHVEAVAPAVGLLRPLGSAPVVADVLARADRRAVGDARGERLELAAHRSCGRLVVEREPLLDFAASHERASFPDKREHLCVPVAETSTELVRAVEQLQGLRQVRLHEQGDVSLHRGQPGVLP